MYALLFADAGLTTAQVSSLFAIWSVVAFAAEIPSGALADVWSRKRLYAIGETLTAAGYAMWLLWPSYWGFTAGFVLWGLGGALGSGALEALVYDAIPEERAYARLMGRAETVSILAMLAATLLATPALHTGGYALVATLSITIKLLGALLSLRLPEPRAPIPHPNPAAPPSPAPTAPPGPAPTAPPTAPPGPAPTASPTAPPGPAPTAPPSPTPTAPPSPTPTASPTAPSRPAPTAPPGPAPTASPTAPPGPAPTAPPSPTPTASSRPAPTAPPGPAPTAPLSPAPTASPGPTQSDIYEMSYWRTLRSGVREAVGTRVVARAVLVAALVPGFSALDEYLPLLARDKGALTEDVPLLFGLTALAMAAGSALAGRGRGLSWALGGAAVLLAAGALIPYVSGMIVVSMAFGLLQYAMIRSEARLQDRITGPARTTVLSVAGFASEMVAVGLYLGFAVDLPLAVLFALCAVPLTLTALVARA
ncbi:MFS transporter [Actinoplanes sp. CA-054009]